MSDRSVDNAVVVGAGIAGLLAAAALSPRSGTVTILERRRVPTEGGIESLAPQGDFAHALLAGGAQAIERLLPGFLDDLVADDPFVTDIGADVPVYWRAAGTIRREIPWLGTRVPQVGRPLLESRMRARVQSLGNVEIRGEAVVDGIGVADGVVRGVRTRNDMVECDLLVDAAGRTSRSQAWLLDAGVPNVPATIVGVEITYTGLDVARRPDDLEYGALFAAVQNTPELPAAVSPYRPRDPVGLSPWAATSATNPTWSGPRSRRSPTPWPTRSSAGCWTTSGSRNRSATGSRPVSAGTSRRPETCLQASTPWVTARRVSIRSTDKA